MGGLPEDMQFKLIEPLNTLFKDEVRELGTQLGMPDSIVWRQPFPGPGLGIRVLGELTEEKLTIVRDSDAILREEIANAGLDRDIWQYFTVLPGIRSVGVMGDGRTYDYTVGIRAVTSIDGMTADFARIPWEVLQKSASASSTKSHTSIGSCTILRANHLLLWSGNKKKSLEPFIYRVSRLFSRGYSTISFYSSFELESEKSCFIFLHNFNLTFLCVSSKES